MPPDFLREETFLDKMPAGMDEAGRGPWAGPVVAAIVVLNPSFLPKGVNDSKQLSRPRREALFDDICTNAYSYGIGSCSPEEIDRHNILGATKLAMRRAYDAMSGKPGIVFVDGNQLPALPCAMEAIVDGDSLCMSVAAASILAKVTRDRMMAELAQRYPQYGWERNAGYGTREHQAALARFGVTPEHRRSFAPIRKLLELQAA